MVRVGHAVRLSHGGQRQHRIQAIAEQGLKAGVGSTPSFVIGGRIYAGVLPYDKIKALVDSLSPAP